MDQQCILRVIIILSGVAYRSQRKPNILENSMKQVYYAKDIFDVGADWFRSGRHWGFDGLERLAPA